MSRKEGREETFPHRILNNMTKSTITNFLMANASEEELSEDIEVEDDEKLTEEE